MSTIAAPSSTDGHRRADRANASVRRQAARSNRGRIAAGALLLAGSALLAVAVYGNLGNREPVLAVSRTVDPGQIIEPEDLTVVRVAADPGVATVASSERAAVVGQRATTRLLPGQLLTPAGVSDGPALPPGLSVIGAVVRDGQYPLGLRAGDAVEVVVTGSTNSGGATGSGSGPVDAVLVSVSASDGASGTAISLAVPTDDASRLAVAGAEARLVLLVPPP